MQADEVRVLLKARPFEPIEIGLSDGRKVRIRHPDQAAVSQRKLFVGLAKIHRAGRLVSPADGDEIATDWILIDVIHIVSAEPVNGDRPTGRRRARRR
jgi:hypothetical protein